MTRFIIIFLFLTATLHGQKCDTIYSFYVGKYKCIPDFYENRRNSPGILSAMDESKLLNHSPITFPMRYDTILVSHADSAKPYKIVKPRDKYEFDAGLDSISYDKVDSLISCTLTIRYDSKKLKLISYNIDIIYTNGQRKTIESTTKRLIDNNALVKALKKDKCILYIGIHQINFKNQQGRHLEISEGYGWKINCS